MQTGCKAPRSVPHELGPLCPENFPRAWVLLLLAGAALMAGYACLPILRGEVFIEDELSALHLPYRYFYAQCLANHESFLWTPGFFCGYYIHGEGEAGYWHPLHLLLYRALPFAAAFDLEVLSPIPIAFAGMLWLLRRWRQAWPAALMGAVAFAFGGWMATAYYWTNMVQVVAWTPGLLACIHLAMYAENRRECLAGGLGVAFFTALQVLTGYQALTAVSSLGEGAYALLLAAQTRRVRPLFWLAAAKGLALALGAIQILPTLDVLAQSNRAVEGWTQTVSMHPVNILQLINPHLFARRTWDAPVCSAPYAGAATLMLALCTVAFFRQYEPRQRTLIAALWLLAAGCVVAATGEYGRLYPLLYQHPFLEKLIAADRHLAFSHLSLSLLAALGFGRILCRCQAGLSTAWRGIAGLCLVPLASMAVSLFAIALRAGMLDRDQQALFQAALTPPGHIAAGALIFSSGAALVILCARGYRWAVPLLVIFALADLSWYGLRHKSAAAYAEFVAGIDVPEAPSTTRLATDMRPVYSRIGPILRGFEVTDGHSAVPPRRHYSMETDRTALRLAGTGWIRARLGTTPELSRAYRQGQTWMPIEDPMPPARLVTQTKASQNMATDLARIDIRTTALLESAIDLPPGTPGVARLLEAPVRPGRIRIETEATTRQLLVTTYAHHPGWKLFVDGQPAAVLPVFGDFIGAVAEPGKHIFEFTFDPASYRCGKWISVAAVLAALTVATGLLFTRKARTIRS